MSVSLEEIIAKLDEARKRGILGICGIKISYILKLLRELQERRKADNEIPFGDSYSFTELDSIINAYEVHGGYYKEVVELLKELRERRKQSEIIRCGKCVHFGKEDDGEMWCGICNGFGLDENSFCSFAERRTNE